MIKVKCLLLCPSVPLVQVQKIPDTEFDLFTVTFTCLFLRSVHNLHPILNLSHLQFLRRVHTSDTVHGELFDPVTSSFLKLYLSF